MNRAVVVVCALLLAAPARAETRLTPEFQSGGRMPVGYYGVALDVQPLPWASVSAGVGLMNFQGSSQVQVALAPRLRWPALSWLALDAGLAVSLGRRSDYVTIPADQTGAMNPGSVTRTWSPGFRLGPELGVELAPLPHGRLRLFGGLSYPLDEASCWVPAPDGASAQTMPCGGPQVPALARDSQDPQPYLGLAVGWSLSPAQGQHLPPAAWYGWQTMLLDVGAATLVALSGPGADSRRTPFRYAAEQQAPLVFVTGGPLVHLTHRRPLPAAASLLLRGGSLVAGWLIGSRWDANECIRFGCKSSYVITGAAVVASAVDAAWLAWDR